MRFQGLLGIAVFLAIAWIISEKTEERQQTLRHSNGSAGSVYDRCRSRFFMCRSSKRFSCC